MANFLLIIIMLRKVKEKCSEVRHQHNGDQQLNLIEICRATSRSQHIFDLLPSEVFIFFFSRSSSFFLGSLGVVFWASYLLLVGNIEILQSYNIHLNRIHVINNVSILTFCCFIIYKLQYTCSFGRLDKLRFFISIIRIPCRGPRHF